MTMFPTSKKTSGFTLIEVLVVITIIGLLASSLLAVMATARAKARDAARISSVKELQKALELYRNANGGNYPCATTMPACSFGGGQVNVNGSSRTAVFDTAISPYLTLQNDSTVFSSNPTWGSIIYRVGGSTNFPVLNSYTIMVRREVRAINGAGSTTDPGVFCDIRVGPSPSTNWPDANNTNCF